ncbi:uncharacterized protein LOC143607849 [Bidens hawaiensis]|uniref:uncharacterized protein LOC143607849 n=1 Tax=Bidens hawaiensis TaxID=980011 RepID=UPI004049064F
MTLIIDPKDKVQHYYNFDYFNNVVGMEIQEFGDRFNEINTNLLQNMLGKIDLAFQLGLYINSVRKDERFANLKGIADLARVMMETTKHISFHLVYRLLKLTLVLPIATVTVERCFSVMKTLKTNLHNRIGEYFLNACVICSVEKEAL